MAYKKIAVFFALFFLLAFGIYSWAPPSDINLFNFYKVVNGSDINATNFYQGGNAVLDTSSISTANVNSSTYWDGESSQANLNVNSSNYWDGESSQADLNVNSSNYWDGMNTPLDFNVVIAAGNITAQEYFYGKFGWQILAGQSDDWLSWNGTDLQFNETTFNASIPITTNITQVATMFVNRTKWTSIDNYPTGCAANKWVRGVGDTLACVQPNIANVTSGTFSSGNYVMSDNLTVEAIELETNGRIWSNATATVIEGPSSSIILK